MMFTSKVCVVNMGRRFSFDLSRVLSNAGCFFIWRFFLREVWALMTLCSLIKKANTVVSLQYLLGVAAWITSLLLRHL